MFSTVGSWISKSVEAVAEKVGVDAKLDEQYNDAEEDREKQQADTHGESNAEPEMTTTSKKSIIPTAGTDGRGVDLPLWEEPPKQLVQHRDAWRTLVLGLLQDENTFIVSKKRLMEEGEGDGWKAVLRELNVQQVPLPSSPAGAEAESNDVDWDARIGDAALCTAMDSKISRIQEMLVSNSLPDLNKLRYKISPHFVSDANFWENLRFRLCVLHQCTTLESLINILEPLNTEPNPEKDPNVQRKRNVGTAHNGAVLQQIRDAVNAKTIQTEWIEKKKVSSLESLEAGRNSCSMLKSLLVQKDSTEAELLESVAESCKYHKTKVGGLIGELSAPGTPEKVRGSGLEPEGSIMEQLLTLNEDLQHALEAFTIRTPAKPGVGSSAKTTSGGASVSPIPVAAGGASNDDVTPNSSSHVLGSTSMKRAESTSSAALETQSSQAGSPAAGATTTDGDNTFNASLPWDDDD